VSILDWFLTEKVVLVSLIAVTHVRFPNRTTRTGSSSPA
jgi:hypothetical protein